MSIDMALTRPDARGAERQAWQGSPVRMLPARQAGTGRKERQQAANRACPPGWPPDRIGPVEIK